MLISNEALFGVLTRIQTVPMSLKGKFIVEKKILSINMHVAGLSAELIIEAPSQ